MTPLLVAGVAALGAIGASVAFVRSVARGHLYSEDEVPSTPVGLVLGAQVYPNGQPSRFLTARLDLALRLYAAGKITVIIVSGDHGAPEYDEPAAMRRYLVDHGVPGDRIVEDPAGYDTYDSAARAVQIYGVDRLTVITQTYHLPRAVATFRLLGLDAAGVGDDSVLHSSRSWWKGVIRDQVACVKTVLDVATNREPELGPFDPSVQLALRTD